MNVKKVEFKSVGVKLVGDLYLPDNFDPKKKYRAVVITPPFHQIKDQIPAFYGPKFAKKGFIALGFDYTSKGESDSYDKNIRNDDNIFRKQEDLRNAVSFLGSLDYVDSNKIHGVGVCLGASIMNAVVITDLRIKSFANVSGMGTTDLITWSSSMRAVAPFGLGWLFALIGKFKHKKMNEKLMKMNRDANQARQKIFETQKGIYKDAIGNPKEAYNTKKYHDDHPELSPMIKEGNDYYYTKRAGSQTYKNFTNDILANYDEWTMINIGEHYVDKIVQPFIAVIGTKAPTGILTKAFYRRVKSKKEMVKIPNATHVGLYDDHNYVNIAVDKISEFFEMNSLE